MTEDDDARETWSEVIGENEDRETRFDRLRSGLADLPDPDPTLAQDEGLLVEADIEPEPVAPRPMALYDDRPANIVLPLSYPFELEGVRYETVGLRPPAFEAVEDVQNGRITMLELIAHMADIPVAALRKMRWPDSDLVTINALHIAPEMRRA